MDWPRLDTRSWNLSLGVAATTMAACGPMITLDSDSATVGATEGDTNNATDTGPPPNTTTPPQECQNSSDCEPGWDCINNVCQYGGYYNSEGYYCQDGTAGCCYDGCYYYECYGNEDCGPGGLCGEDYGNGNCSFVEPVPECAELPLLPGIPIVEDNEDAIVSLSFVDANGDSSDDLIVSHASGATTLYPGFGGDPPFPLPFPAGMPVLAVFSGDFNGDGLSDLVGMQEGGLVSILTGNGVGFNLAAAFPGAGIFADLGVLDWDGNGTLDLSGIGAGNQAVVALGNGAAGLGETFALQTGGAVEAVRSGVFGPDVFDDLAIHENGQTQLYYGNAEGDIQPDAELYADDYGPKRLVVADFDGGGFTDVTAHTTMFEWVLLDSWRDGSGAQSRQALYGGGFQLSSTGDVNGDGADDAVLAGESSLTVLRGNIDGGNAPMFGCQYPHEYPLDGPPQALAVGDVDGDGHDDIVVADQANVMFLLSP